MNEYNGLQILIWSIVAVGMLIGGIRLWAEIRHNLVFAFCGGVVVVVSLFFLYLSSNEIQHAEEWLQLFPRDSAKYASYLRVAAAYKKNGVTGLIIGGAVLVLSLAPDIMSWMRGEVKNYRRTSEYRRVSNRIHKGFTDGSYEFPYEEFYLACKENYIKTVSNTFSRQKACQLAEKAIRNTSEYKLLTETARKTDGVSYLEDSEVSQYVESHIEQIFDRMEDGYRTALRVKEEKRREQEEKEKEARRVLEATVQSCQLSQEAADMIRFNEELSQADGKTKHVKMLQAQINELQRVIDREKEAFDAAHPNDTFDMQRVAAAMELASMVRKSAYQEKKSSWSVAGGIASGIAGPAAGVAAAVDTMLENQRIDQRNAANKRAADDLGDKIIASAMPKPETKEERLARYRAQESMDKSLAPIKERINRLYKAKTAAEDLVILFDDELKLVSSISQLKTDVVSQREGTRISLTLSTHYKADAPSNIVMGLDGSLRAKLYTGDTYVGDAIIPLPLYGLPCNGQTRICIGFCRSYMEGKHTYSIKIEPIHLWLTERGK